MKLGPLHLFSLIMITATLSLIPQAKSRCVKNTIKIWSPTKCVAGRRFFARLNRIPSVYKSSNNQTVVQPYAFPWIVEISTNYAGCRNFCTGTLINDRYILAAQHCVLRPLEEDHVIVNLGFTSEHLKQDADYFQPRTLQRTVLQIIRHPHFDSQDRRTAQNDLALLKIEPVKYSKTIYPIQLQTSADNYKDYSGLNAENVNWGYDSGNSRSLQQLQVKILSQRECRNFNVFYSQMIDPGVLCSLTVGGNYDPCDRFVGGPLTIENEKRIYKTSILIGIVSWSAPKSNACVQTQFPVVHIRIDDKLNWIKENTWDAKYCRY